MKNVFLVSVIVPMYNVEKYLSQCIESIMAQTYENLEIILVDDGSVDNTGKIADTYASCDNRIRVLHTDNKGVSSARNYGIEISEGDYICFVDADDYIMPDYVEYLLGLIGDADISLTTDMFSNFDNKQNVDDVLEIYTAERATEQILCYNIPIGVYCKMYKRSFLGDELRFISTLVIGEGFNFNTLTFQRANYVVVGHRKIYYYRRNNPTSVTTKFSANKWENGLYAIDVIKKDFVLHSKKLIKAWEYAYWRTHTDVYDAIVLAGAEEKCPDLYKKCLRVVRNNALSALRVPTSKRNKIRALIMMIFPRIIPWAMKQRRIKYDAEV